MTKDQARAFLLDLREIVRKHGASGLYLLTGSLVTDASEQDLHVAAGSVFGSIELPAGDDCERIPFVKIGAADG